MPDSLSDAPETVRLRAIITVEYDAQIRHYPSADPKEMAQVDESNLRDGGVEDLLEWGEADIRVEPVT